MILKQKNGLRNVSVKKMTIIRYGPMMMISVTLCQYDITIAVATKYSKLLAKGTPNYLEDEDEDKDEDEDEDEDVNNIGDNLINFSDLRIQEIQECAMDFLLGEFLFLLLTRV